jgi:hypothetical protein
MTLNVISESGWSKKMQQIKKNLVAKHARTFNVAAVHIDRKKAEKSGKVKHKGEVMDHE